MTDVWADAADALAGMAERGKALEFWWRDDDIAGHTDRFAPMADLSARIGISPLLAAIPERTDQSISQVFAVLPEARAAVHGYAHVSHAGQSGRKSELGPERAVAVVIADLRRGYDRLSGLVGPALLPVVVPPWNRIADDVVRALPQAGFHGLSTYGGKAIRSVPALTWRDTHVDVVDWAVGRKAKSPAQLARELIALAERPVTGPIGVLTHHLDHDAADWVTIGRLFDTLRAVRGSVGLDPAAVFAGAAP